MCFKIKKIYVSAEPDKGNPDARKNFNTDVIVLAEEEDEDSTYSTVKYVASFFTYTNLFELQAQHVKTGEYLNGKYFYAKNMVLVDGQLTKTAQQRCLPPGIRRSRFYDI